MTINQLEAEIKKQKMSLEINGIGARRLYIDIYLWLDLKYYLSCQHVMKISGQHLRENYHGLDVIVVLRKDFVKVEGDLICLIPANQQ